MQVAVLGQELCSVSRIQARKAHEIGMDEQATFRPRGLSWLKRLVMQRLLGPKWKGPAPTLAGHDQRGHAKPAASFQPAL